ncbi:MAG: phosphoglycerate mutase, partial [Methanobacteriaceae archaeon]|nr:phosphoglycerate mutase [Methanobacteriaceae archaeon]
MKYVILIGDGMADYPLKELNNKTPLQAANIPNMDKLATKGASGLLKTVPEGMDPGSDVANLSIMGYNPSEYYTGRGPLEAASMGVELSDGDVAFRCNFITKKDDILEDFNAGHITTPESGELIDVLNQNFEKYGKFYHGISYRNLFIFNKKESVNLKTVPPHDIVGQKISENIVKPESDENARLINKIMEDSENILLNTEVNKKRLNNNKKPANRIWLWGQGSKPQID